MNYRPHISNTSPTDNHSDSEFTTLMACVSLDRAIPEVEIAVRSLCRHIRFSDSPQVSVHNYSALMMVNTALLLKANIIVPHSLTRWTPETQMEDLLKAQWSEHIIENQVQSVEQSLRPSREPLLDVPIQNQLLEGKLNRARLEVQLYSEALAKEAEYFRARHHTCAITTPPIISSANFS
jgi:hypothetical protein